MINKIFIAVTAVLVLTCSACKKSWLDEKPDLTLIEPTTIEDYQSLLDNTYVIAGGNSINFNNNQPSLGEMSVGEYSVPAQTFSTLSPLERNAYLWNKDIYNGSDNFSDWVWAYKRIFTTNVILEGIAKINVQDEFELNSYSNVKGAAHFFRGYNHYNVAQQFCKPYDKASAPNEPGIPLKLKSDVLATSYRSTIEETYQEILNDVKAAAEYLPVEKPYNTIYKSRPTKAAAYALLARIYLSMSLYDSALSNANKCLSIYDKLMDYNNSPFVTPASNNSPIKGFNDEVIFNDLLGTFSVYQPLKSTVDPALYALFNDNDIRKKAFFRLVTNVPNFKGSYWGFYFPFFSGLAVDEVHLIKAECLARTGNVNAAMQVLNNLMRLRWKSLPGGGSTYTDQTAGTETQALTIILTERRKELCFRGLRWSDLRRLNMDTRFATTLTRTDGANTVTLPPNSSLYVLPFPPDVISISGMEQNPR